MELFKNEKYEIKFYQFKNSEWNYIKIKTENKTIIYVNKKVGDN